MVHYKDQKGLHPCTRANFLSCILAFLNCIMVRIFNIQSMFTYSIKVCNSLVTVDAWGSREWSITNYRGLDFS